MVHIEIKIPYGEVGPLERRVHEILIDHKGPTCVIGFNPYSHAWFADHHPKVLRGLNSYSYKGADARQLAPELRKRYAELGHVAIARPHFLSLGLDMLPHPKADALRKGGKPVIAWTVRELAQWEAVRDHCDNLIFEGFAA
jgi:glycerophosphoryl diester phosphodiesterase